MDEPGLDPELHRQALGALARVNVLAGVTGRVWRRVVEISRLRAAPVRVLDVACGGGDVMIRLARRASRHRLPLEVHGCDRSPFAVAHARHRAGVLGVRAEFFELDVVRQPLADGYDLVCSSLFLHHLGREEAGGLLRSMARAGRHGLVQDLARSRLGLAIAAVALHTTTTSTVARTDGLRSVRAAFTVDELQRLARDADLPDARVSRRWPERLILEWSASERA